MILNMDSANNVDNRAAIAKSNFRNRKLAIYTKQYPEIGRFPVPIQKLLAVELEKVKERIEEGKGVPAFEDDTMKFCCKYVVFPGRFLNILNADFDPKISSTVSAALPSYIPS